MTLKEIIKENAALQYVVSKLEILSAVGNRQLLTQEFITKRETLVQEWNNIGHAITLFTDDSNRHAITELRHQLMCLHDIQNTLQRLQVHQVMDEVELFEIKNFAHIAGMIRHHISDLKLDGTVCVDDLSDVFKILDPDNTGIANFYIYDSYDSRLEPLRKELKKLQLESSADDSTAQERIGILLDLQDKIQQEVVQQLSDKLQPFAARMLHSLERCGYCDILLAKAIQSIEWELTQPIIGDNISIKQLIHPQLCQMHKAKGLRYQPIDIVVGKGTCLITGANMAGKTVLLKALACAQLMAQTGMYVAARECRLPLFDDIVACIGDDQDEMKGLSSYAAEILRISEAIGRSRKQSIMLLIDEPARTTNPIEGQALVRAIADILNRQRGICVITTHYSGLGHGCQRLRVKGFDEKMSDQTLNTHSINQFIDYSLVEDDSDDVPHEALRIAELLHCDSEMIELAKKSVDTI